MASITILMIVILLLLALIALEVPVAFSLLTSGGIGLALLRDVGYSFNTLATAPFATVSAFTLTLIPMFIVMGMFVVQARIADDIYAFAARIFRRVPGGLGFATVAACGGFAAVTGSSAATVATVGRISIGEMRKHGYSASFASGIVGASGTLGILIPPSIVLVIYGTLSGESIGLLLIAGIVPGIISALLYMIVVAIRARKEVAPQYVIGNYHPGGAQPGIDSLSSGLAAVVKILILFLIVVGGIYSGLFTATESGAVAALAAFIMLVYTGIRRRRIRLLAHLRAALEETATVTGMIFMLLIGGGVFTFFMASGGYARSFASWVIDLPVSPHIVIVLFLVMLIPLGMVLDGLSIMLITVPLIHPVAVGLGFDGIWFAILVVKMIELGLITPPVGINVYVVAGSTPGLSVEDVFRGIWPFALADVGTVVLFLVFPTIVTFLPAAMAIR